MPLNEPHEDGIGVGEVLKLGFETVRPLLAVKEIVAKPPDDHHHSQQVLPPSPDRIASRWSAGRRCRCGKRWVKTPSAK